MWAEPDFAVPICQLARGKYHVLVKGGGAAWDAGRQARSKATGRWGVVQPDSAGVRSIRVQSCGAGILNKEKRRGGGRDLFFFLVCPAPDVETYFCGYLLDVTRYKYGVNDGGNLDVKDTTTGSTQTATR